MLKKKKMKPKRVQNGVTLPAVLISSVFKAVTEKFKRYRKNIITRF